MTSGRPGSVAMNAAAAAAYASPSRPCRRAMSESANGASAPARSTASRSAGEYASSAVAMMRTFGRAPGSTSIAARFMPSPEVPDIIPMAITPGFSRERGRDGFVDRDSEAVHRVVVRPAEVHAVREQDDREIELWIDPERRAGETGVPVRVDAEVATDHRPIRRAQREADAPSHVALFHPLGPRESGQLVADDGAVPEHAREGRNVRRGAEETGVAGAPADRDGGLG